MKIRIFPEHNYKAFHTSDGTTIRLALDSSKPIGELDYPEFYDVKITSNCGGKCSYCYQSSVPKSHDRNIVEKFLSFFSPLTKNQKPFQIAFGGGEPTSHPDFISILRACLSLGITPNYTTNGMHINDDLLKATKELCGGVAVSTHPHLETYWRAATDAFLAHNIFTNLHVIISDKNSIDRFVKNYEEYKGRVKYFVLLPLSAQGRCKESQVDWDYLKASVSDSPADIAFGANFYPYLQDGRFNVSMYEPEILSKYLDLETMKVYPSSFSTKELYQT
jgi:organic radical activating enzyme